MELVHTILTKHDKDDTAQYNNKVFTVQRKTPFSVSTRPDFTGKPKSNSSKVILPRFPTERVEQKWL